MREIASVAREGERRTRIADFPQYGRPEKTEPPFVTGQTGWAWSDPRRTHVCMVTVRPDAPQFTDCGIKLAYFSSTRPSSELYPTCPGCMARRSYWRRELLLGHRQPYTRSGPLEEDDGTSGWTLGTDEGELKADAIPAEYLNSQYTQQTASAFEDYVIDGLEDEMELIQFCLRRH